MIASSEHHNILTFTHDAFNGAPEGTERAPAAQTRERGAPDGLFSCLAAGPSASSLRSTCSRSSAWSALPWRCSGSSRALAAPRRPRFSEDTSSASARTQSDESPPDTSVHPELDLCSRGRSPCSRFANDGHTRAPPCSDWPPGSVSTSRRTRGSSPRRSRSSSSSSSCRGVPSDRSSRSLALLSFTLIVNALALVPLALVYRSERTAFQATASHGGADLLYFGARVGAYLLPGPSNPLFHWVRGSIPETSSKLLRRIHDDRPGRHRVRLAVSTGRMASRLRPALVDRDLACRSRTDRFILSLPPAYRVGSPRSFRRPRSCIAGLTAYWRVYSRFGMVAGFALALLARSPSPRSRRGRLFRADSSRPARSRPSYSNCSPGISRRSTRPTKPGWVAWLAKAPHGIVATYPLADSGAKRVTLEAILVPSARRRSGISRSPREPQRNPLAAAGNPLASRRPRRAPYGSCPEHANESATSVIDDNIYKSSGHTPPSPAPRYYQLLKRIGGVRTTQFTRHRSGSPAPTRARAEIARREGFKSPTIVLQSGFGPARRSATVDGRRLGKRGVIAVHNPGDATHVRLSGYTVNQGTAVVIRVSNAKGKTHREAGCPRGRRRTDIPANSDPN